MKTLTYFAVKSDVSLSSVTSDLKNMFALPDFVFEAHGNWEYASSGNSNIGFNVTKSDDFETIESWSKDCPPGVNFQLIVEFEDEPENFLGNLQSIFSADVVNYANLEKKPGMNIF